MSLASCLTAATSAAFPGAPEFGTALSFNANQLAVRTSGAPAAFAFPSSESEAVSVVNCARQFNVSIVPRSGGHSYEAFSVAKDALVIDTHRLIEITIDSTSETAVVGAGNWSAWAHLRRIAGHALGGGYGLLSRQLGLVSDAILEVRLIDAAGMLRIVNTQSDPDLFWALRGAGANNFGLVTSFKFKIFPLPSALSTKQYTWANTVENRNAVVATFSNYGPSLPNEITAEVYLDSSYLALSLFRFGPLSGLDAIASPLLAKLPPNPEIVDSAEFGGYVDLVLHENGNKITRPMLQDHGLLQETDYFKASSFLSTGGAISSEGINVLNEGGPIQVGSGNNAFVLLDLWGGAISNVAPDDTAFIHRAKDQIGYQLWWGWTSDSSNVDGFNAWRKQVAQYMPSSSYQNYVDREVPLTDYYGVAGLSKLVGVKKRVDPGNLFRFADGVTMNTAATSASFPGTPEFSTALAFNANQLAVRTSGIPAVFVFPSSESEAVAAVSCARQFNISVVPRSGGHSYEAFSVAKDALIIDTHHLTEITIDSKSQTAVIGAGNWLGRIYDVLDSNGRFVIPGGTCPPVGIAGHALGGGYGLLSRQLGLVSDAILEVRLIDASGSLRIVNSQSDPDLFWALR
ncbi:hypothetical protein HDU99_007861, partial [Rhizoclosmatium hyalinum]